jgi:hypothetical protein
MEVINLISSDSDEPEEESGAGVQDELELEHNVLNAPEEEDVPSEESRTLPSFLVEDGLHEEEDSEHEHLQLVREVEPSVPDAASASAPQTNNGEEISPATPTATPCPTGCGGFLTQRRRKRDDSPFWACTNFASNGCQYTEAYVDPSRQHALVEGNSTLYSFHSTKKKRLKSGRNVQYKECAEKKRRKCPARIRVDLDTGDSCSISLRL